MSLSKFRERAANVGRRLATQPLIRAIYFHNIPRSRTAEYHRQFEHYSRHFAAVGELKLD